MQQLQLGFPIINPYFAEQERFFQNIFKEKEVSNINFSKITQLPQDCQKHLNNERLQVLSSVNVDQYDQSEQLNIPGQKESIQKDKQISINEQQGLSSDGNNHYFNNICNKQDVINNNYFEYKAHDSTSSDQSNSMLKKINYICRQNENKICLNTNQDKQMIEQQDNTNNNKTHTQYNYQQEQYAVLKYLHLLCKNKSQINDKMQDDKQNYKNNSLSQNSHDSINIFQNQTLHSSSSQLPIEQMLRKIESEKNQIDTKQMQNIYNEMIDLQKQKQSIKNIQKTINLKPNKQQEQKSQFENQIKILNQQFNKQNDIPSFQKSQVQSIQDELDLIGSSYDQYKIWFENQTKILNKQFNQQNDSFQDQEKIWFKNQTKILYQQFNKQKDIHSFQKSQVQSIQDHFIGSSQDLNSYSKQQQQIKNQENATFKIENQQNFIIDNPSQQKQFQQQTNEKQLENLSQYQQQKQQTEANDKYPQFEQFNFQKSDKSYQYQQNNQEKNYNQIIQQKQEDSKNKNINTRTIDEIMQILIDWKTQKDYQQNNQTEFNGLSIQDLIECQKIFDEGEKKKFDFQKHKDRSVKFLKKKVLKEKSSKNSITALKIQQYIQNTKLNQTTNKKSLDDKLKYLLNETNQSKMEVENMKSEKVDEVEEDMLVID